MCCCFALLVGQINPLKAKLNPICHLLAVLRAHLILHVSSLRVNAINRSMTTEYKSVSRLVARGVEVDAMHPLQIWLNPL
jgi:hypothetical protein